MVLQFTVSTVGKGCVEKSENKVEYLDPRLLDLDRRCKRLTGARILGMGDLGRSERDHAVGSGTHQANR